MTENRIKNDPSGALWPTRRNLLRGVGVSGGAAMLATLAPVQSASAATEGVDAPNDDLSRQSVPFYGAHQAGITTPTPGVGIVAAFDVTADDRKGLESLFRKLTARIAFLTTGGPYQRAGDKFPPLDSGILGPEVTPDNLTVTVAVGNSLFDQRFGLASVKPQRLQRMKSFPNDALDSDWCHGDLMIQFCANRPETAIHALRDIIKNTPGLLALRWKLDGFLPTIAQKAHEKMTGRNLLGFKDGTGNPDPSNSEIMKQVVWVGSERGEPAWAVGGSYQVVRIIRHFLERWDRTPLQEQEAIFGRTRDEGAPIGKEKEFDDPNYPADPEGKLVPLTAHMRLANPRTPETRPSLLLRRAFNYSRGVTKSGQLDMGLIFICFQADLEASFLAVQKRLNGEPLEEYIKPTGGGYYFVLPGVPSEGNYLGQGMLEAAV
jgi:deferrochelatase/peroxidase EfeB